MTDRQTDRPTDKVTYRVACTRLKIPGCKRKKGGKKRGKKRGKKGKRVGNNKKPRKKECIYVWQQKRLGCHKPFQDQHKFKTNNTFLCFFVHDGIGYIQTVETIQ